MAGGQYGDTATVTFEVSTPMLATRAVGDGTAVGKDGKLYVAVYEKGGQGWSNPLGASKITFENAITFDYVNGVATAPVKLDLAKNKDYSIVFWAETNENGDAYTIDWNAGGTLSLNTDKLKANQESYDAFWAQTPVKLTGAMTQKIELKRPFAQLNIGTSDKDAAKNAGIIVEQTAVTVKQIPTVLNLQDSKVDDNSYADVTYDLAEIAGIEGETFPADNQKYLSLNYLLVNEKITVDVDFTYKDAEDAPYSLSFTSVPVQRNWRTNIYGTLLTNSANYTVEIKPGFGGDNEQDAGNIVYASTADEVLKALSAEEESIRIVLLNDITLPGGTSAYTTNAKEVIIESNQSASTRSESGQKFTLTFKDSYRTYFGLANKDAKVTFNNVNIYRETTGGTHWHNNNMKFTCNAEFNNVAFNKGICFDNAKTFVMNNCSINKGKVATYALFITAGCDVTIDGLSVTHSEGVAGRGIKIVDEDVAEKDALTTLSVSNATFVTEAKAAILVGSKGGAKITLSNLDLSGVKADGFNAVWIDEDYKGISVEVEGGFCVTEGETQTEENNPFLVKDGEVNLPAGTFVMPTAVANGVTVIGAKDGTTVLDMTGANPAQITGLTFKNVTINVGNEIYHGMTHTSELTYDNCVINGTLFLYSTAVFNNCTFNVEGDNYNVWTYGSTEATFNTCTFNCDGKSVLVYNEGGNGSVITMNQCQFSASAAVEGKAAVEIDSSLLPEGMTYVVNLNGCTAEGFGKGSVSNEMLFNQKKGSKATIYVDGYKAVSTEEELKAAINAANNTEFTQIALTSKTFTGAFDIDGKSVELVALNKHHATIDGLVHGLDYAHITLKNLVLTNATPATSTSARHNADGYCLGAYVADILIDDCIFNVKSTGKGAINIYANRSDYELYDDFDLTVKNTTFNCNGERPIRGKTNSWIEGCTFIDQHRYAIQVQGNVSLSSETVKFIGNKIIDPCKTSGESYAAGVSISKSQLLEDAHFIIEGNTLESTKFDNLKFVYDLNDNVKITTCTLNGKAIVEGQLEAIEGVDDAKEVLDDVQYTWATTTRTFTAYTAKGLKKANEMMADKSMGRDATLVLGANIDFSGYTWKTVDSHADTAFEIKEIDGRGYTLSNLTVSGKAMFSRFAGFGDVVIKDITFDNANINSGDMNTAIIVGQSYQNVLLDNVDVKNSSVTGTYKVAPFIATVYNENPSTITATLKNCDVNGVNVKCTSFDFCTAGMVAFVYEGNNDKVEFENCTIKNLHLSARPNGYASHAWIYVNDAETDDTFNSAEGVTVDESTCTFTRL